MLEIRNSLLVLTRPEIQQLLLSGAQVPTATAPIRKAGPELDYWIMLFPVVLEPADWGTYRVTFLFGSLVAIAELPAAHRNYTLH